MKAPRRPVWRRHPWLSALFVLALLLALGFGARVVLLARHWKEAPPVAEGWMTPRYLVHSYHIDPQVLATILQKRPGEGPRDTLAEIAVARGVPLETILATVQALLPPHGPAP